jgi:hypothetical protein
MLSAAVFCRVCGVPLLPGTPNDREDTCPGCQQCITAGRMKRLLAGGVPGWEKLAHILFGDEVIGSAGDPASLREVARVIAKCMATWRGRPEQNRSRRGMESTTD